MSAVWKVLVGLVLTLPVGAYVAGTLVSSQANVPDRRAPVVISDNPSPGAAPSADQSPGDDHADDHGDDAAHDLRTVNPTPDQVEDHHGNRGPGGGDDHGGDRHGGEDDHGGSSGSGSSGSGSSGSDDHGGHGSG